MLPILSPAFLSITALNLLDEPTAEKWAEVAWERAPNKVMSCLARTALAQYRDRQEEDLSCYKLMMRVEPDMALPFQILRDLDLRLGDIEQSLKRYRESSPKLFDPKGPEVTKNNIDKAIDLYLVLSKTGQLEFAEELLWHAMEVVRIRPRLSTGGYGWADIEILALQGKTREALAAMRSAIDEGLRMAWWTLPKRLNLQSLWEEPQFKSMLAELETDMIARRDAINADKITGSE